MTEIVSRGTATYGLPHLGAEYVNGWSNHKRNYRRIADVCVICDSQRATNTHHVDAIGSGGHQSSREVIVDVSFCEDYDRMPGLLKTEMGIFIVYTPLFAVCGSGTTGCHGEFEEYRYIAEWVWNDQESHDLWYAGWMLSHGYSPHDPRLFEFGYWRILRDGQVFKEVKHAY